MFPQNIPNKWSIREDSSSFNLHNSSHQVTFLRPKMNISMTKHASVRQQKRGIPPLITEWLTSYGSTRHDHHGAEILFFDKQSRRLLAKEVGNDVVRRLSNYLDTYAVISGDGTVITVGHRLTRIRTH